MRILLLEDEEIAGQKLKRILENLSSDLSIDWLRDLDSAQKYLDQEEEPDLIFSDIELLDGHVFSLFTRIQIHCPIIFCTAYNRFYAEAFESNGIAYVLKPYQAEDIQKAWRKYEQWFSEKNSANETQNWANLFKNLPLAPQKRYKTTLTVKKRDGVYLLKTDDIAYLRAKGDFALAIDQNGQSHMIPQGLGQLNENLNPQDFFRINRSEIVNFRAILKFETYTKNRLAIHLSSPREVLYTSNAQGPTFKVWIENH